jgi:metal-responsive CopG/Arc/MetJ family transcriptional regulator
MHYRIAPMPPNERITVTLPAEVVRDIDRLEKNRSKFVLEAVRHELKRRRREISSARSVARIPKASSSPRKGSMNGRAACRKRMLPTLWT